MTRQPELFDAVDSATEQTEQDRIAERSRLRFEKMRAERAAKWAATSDEDILRMRIEESRANCDPMLAQCLRAAVPMWIEEMRGWCSSAIECRGRALTDTITSSQGIAAMVDPDARGTARGGELGKAFNAVAQGLACLAFCPGGIVFAGCHWEVKTDAQTEVEP